MNIKIKIYCNKKTLQIFGIDFINNKHYALINEQYWYEVQSTNIDLEDNIVITDAELSESTNGKHMRVL